MKVTKKGKGDPEIAVVYCTHGDETAGKKAVEDLLNSSPDFKKAVKFVFANQKAYKEGKRFIDTDLNRSFPGEVESPSYEERTAAKLVEELKDLKVLDIHETEVSPSPFALFTWFDEKTVETVRDTNLDRAVEISYTPGCGINIYGGVEVEVGPKGSEKAVEDALIILKQFLVNNGVLEGEVQRSEPEIYSVYSTQNRPTENPELKVENFETVEEGECIAELEVGGALFSEERFVPVLFGQSYPDILGFKSVRLEKVEERIYQ